MRDRCGGDSVGNVDPFFELFVEEALAQRHDAGGFLDERSGELPSRGIELVDRHNAIDETPGECGLRVDEIAGEQHFERALARNVARDRHAGRRTEQP